MKYMIILLLFSVFISCSDTTNKSATLDPKPGSVNRDTNNRIKTSDFYPLKDDLYMDNEGNVGYRVVDRSDPKKPIEKYLMTVWYANPEDSIHGGKADLKKVIDTASFLKVLGVYYKDKNHFYVYNQMADGGNLAVFKDVDIKTFRVLSPNYAKDKRHVYFGSEIINGADLNSFVSIPKIKEGDTIWVYAKDRHNYYYFGDPIKKQDLKSHGFK